MKVQTISVSELKNRLLEIVRQVEKGKTFAITKGNRPVAQLGPVAEGKVVTTAFAKIKIHGNIADPIPVEWGFDAENLRTKP